MSFAFWKRGTPLSAKHAFIILSILMFFFSAQVSLDMYVDSSYLKSTILTTPGFADTHAWMNPDNVIGALYTVASFITLLGLILAPRILRRFGNYKWTLSILIVHMLLLLGLAFSNTAWLVIPLFMVESALTSILYFNFDVFLEHYSKDENTGVIRGIFIAVSSIAWFTPPFFAGIIVDHYGFSLIYLTGALLIIPTVIIMVLYMSGFKDMRYDAKTIALTPSDEKRKPDVARILWVQFFLQFFYAWMIIYAPLYFHDVVGVSYQDFGMIMAVALTAFVIFPTPQGWLADKLLGEKEMLVIGFFLMGISCLAIPYLASFHLGLWWWAALLFIGRSGASTVETMAEVYFFKQIDGHNASYIGSFRRTRPMAFIVAPLLATALLQFKAVDMGGLFILLGLIMLIALYFPIGLKDTR
jgi:MFS family permease